LQYYPLEEILAAEYLLEDFRPDLIDMVLDKLRPEYVRSVATLHWVTNSVYSALLYHFHTIIPIRMNHTASLEMCIYYLF
jgi:hypothetical protein